MPFALNLTIGQTVPLQNNVCITYSGNDTQNPQLAKSMDDFAIQEF